MSSFSFFRKLKFNFNPHITIEQLISHLFLLIKNFKKKCKDDFWYYPKRALCFFVWIFSMMGAYDFYGVR